MEKMVEVWSLERKSSVLALREAKDTPQFQEFHRHTNSGRAEAVLSVPSRAAGSWDANPFACPYSITSDSEVRHM